MLALFTILFVAIGSVCAADIDAVNVSSENEILNSEGINTDSNNLDSGNSDLVEDYHSDSSNVSGSIDSEDISIKNIASEGSVSSDDVKECSKVSNYGVAAGGDVISSGNTVTSLSASNSVTVSQIVAAAKTVVNYVNTNKALPSTVTIGSHKVTSTQFSYLVTKAIQAISAGNTAAVFTIKSYTLGSTVGDTVNLNKNLADAISLAKTLNTFAEKNGYMAGVLTINGKKTAFKVYTYAFASMLSYYSSNKKLPSSVKFASSVYTKTSTSKYVTISQLIKASVSVKSYVTKNKVLPSTVKVGSYTLTISQYSYLAVKAVYYRYNKKATSTKFKVPSVTNKTVSYTFNKKVYTKTYIKVAKSIVKYFNSKKVAPNYVTVSSKKLDFRTYTFGFTKILAYYKTYKKFTKYCQFNSKVFKKNTPSKRTYVTIGELMTSSNTVKSYVEKNKMLPSTVTVGGQKLTIAQFSYLVIKAVYNVYNKKSVNTKLTIPSVTKGDANYGFNKKVYTGAYINAAKSIIKYFDSNKVAPNYVAVSSSKIDYKTYTFGFTKILAYYKNNKNTLPNYCTFDSSVFNKGGGINYKKGINEINTIEDLAPYLKSAGYAKITTAIKNLANSLTKNCKSTLEKANAIFKYVRDTLDYSFYYDSKYGADKTLKYKKANCCDHANLIVALCRSSGIAARYSHATCTFTSGLRVGHVWAQILVGDTWYAADGTSSKNTLGHCNNWAASSMSGLKQYSDLPF